MLNNILIMGRLTADPELKTTQSGVSVCSFNVAVDRDYQKDQTDFITVVAWRSTAEFVSRYFSKGKMIIAQGSLQSRKWQDKDGNNRISWEVQADKVYFGDSKKDGSTAQTSADDGDKFTPLPEDNDLPF